MTPPVPEEAGVPNDPPVELPLLPAELVFLPDPPPPLPKRRFPGPGLIESLGWCLAFWLTLQGAVVVVLTGLFAIQLSGRKHVGELLRDPSEINQLMSQLLTPHMGTIFATAEAASVLFAAVAIMFRLRPGGLSRLGMRLPSAGHALLILFLILPLSYLCSLIMSWMMQLLPNSDFGMAEFLKGMSQLPFPVLVFAIAICPAVGEELIFRGLIGRGLVTRWGVAKGVLVTSVLFGLIHIVPAQALAVIPLGIAMHFVYLTTGSIWGPVLLHFLNNAWAAFNLKYHDQLIAGGMSDDETALSLELIAASAAAVCAVIMLLWQTRVSSMHSTDGVWYPGEPRGDQSSLPEPLFAAQRPRPLLIACGTFCVIGFFAVFLRVTLAAN